MSKKNNFDSGGLLGPGNTIDLSGLDNSSLMNSRSALGSISAKTDISQQQGLWAQITADSKNIYDPFKTVSISADEKEYLETIALAADLLASHVLTTQDFFKLKLLLKSKDEEVRKAGMMFLNQKAKL
jgi:hypothetical protein